MNRTWTICYWTTTAILAFVLLSGGVADLVRVPATTEGVLALGYPDSFLTILGTWKVLGAVAILAPRFPRLKEWAYAGAFFNFTGAVYSHIVSGSDVDHAIWTGIFTVCTVLSWALRPQSRTLGVLLPPAVAAWFVRPDRNGAQSRQAAELRA